MLNVNIWGRKFMREPIPEQYANHLVVYKLSLRCMLSLAWLQVDVCNLSVLGKFFRLGVNQQYLGSF
jgi:hypothetical protein